MIEAPPLATVRTVLPSHPHDGYAYDGCTCVCCLNIRALQVPHRDCTVAADELYRRLSESLAGLVDAVQVHIAERRPFDRDDRLLAALGRARHDLMMTEP